MENDGLDAHQQQFLLTNQLLGLKSCNVGHILVEDKTVTGESRKAFPGKKPA